MSRLALLLALTLAATAPAWVWNPYQLHTLIMAGIFAVLALSLNLLLGYTGQLSLGHAAFFGIGAYATGLLTVKLGWSPWIGLLAAIGLPGAAGYVIGRLALKLRGAYFVLLPNARVLTAIFFILIFFQELPAVLFLGLWFLFQLWDGGFAILHPQSGGGVAFFAHIGGFAFGAATVLLVAVRRPLRPTW